MPGIYSLSKCPKYICSKCYFQYYQFHTIWICINKAATHTNLGFSILIWPSYTYICPSSTHLKFRYKRVVKQNVQQFVSKWNITVRSWLGKHINGMVWLTPQHNVYVLCEHQCYIFPHQRVWVPYKCLYRCTFVCWSYKSNGITKLNCIW